MSVKILGTSSNEQQLYESLGHNFLQPNLLQEALSHSSAINQKNKANSADYERLEFLGDRVLGLVIADMLLKNFPSEAEGLLARRYTALVRKEALAKIANVVGLGNYIILSKGEEENGGRSNIGILCDVCESVIGALYIDGGFEVASAFIKKFWKPMLENELTPPKDAKTELQEWAQGLGLPLPDYKVISTEGSAHEPVFTVEVTIKGKEPVSAKGSSKRLAEQATAQKMLKQIL
ncbi:MAG: ribonuclease III [Alphaproteobacteria bacterium]|nr:ribonuclease III [Alphaproteobacteria bacterium]